MGAGINGGGHVGPTMQGGAHKGYGAPSTLVTKWWVPLVCSKCQNSTKIILNFQGICGTFMLGVFFIAQIIVKIDKKILFLLYLT